MSPLNPFQLQLSSPQNPISNSRVSMKKRRGIEGGDFPLPEVLIQHIQSFMGGKEAAQTSILSKSWYSAWSTRPNLEFDLRHFERESGHRRNEMRFWEFAKKTMQRYEALNLKILSFRLWIRDMLCFEYHSATLVEEFIVKAMKMGAVDFNFEITNGYQSFTLPREVLGSENLIRLSVYGCKIDLRGYREVNCRKLKSLNLNRMWFHNDIICDLISSCPLIEELKLGTFTIHNPGHVIAYGLGSRNLCMLKSLFLGDVDVDTLFFSNLSANFPCLKDLTLDRWGGYNYKGIQIPSRSLECITFFQKKNRLLRANLDVPSIHKFTFVGSRWPSLFFKATSGEWESNISVSCRAVNTAWFLKLKKLLTCLSSSKISLYLCIWTTVEKKNVDFRGLPETTVENLTIRAPPFVWYTVLECLFWSSRPKFIALHLATEWGPSGEVKNDFLEILSERNVEGVRENLLMMNRDLEELDVELFEQSYAAGRHLPEKIHFRLRWRGGRG